MKIILCNLILLALLAVTNNTENHYEVLTDQEKVSGRVKRKSAANWTREQLESRDQAMDLINEFQKMFSSEKKQPAAGESQAENVLPASTKREPHQDNVTLQDSDTSDDETCSISFQTDELGSRNESEPSRSNITVEDSDTSDDETCSISFQTDEVGSRNESEPTRSNITVEDSDTSDDETCSISFQTDEVGSRNESEPSRSNITVENSDTSTTNDETCSNSFQTDESESPMENLMPEEEELEPFRNDITFQLKNYTLHMYEREWFHAKLLCMSEGAQLVVPENQAEAEDIKALLTDKLPGDTIGVYLGIFQDYDHFITVDGRDLKELWPDWVKENQPTEAPIEGKCIVMVNGIMKVASCEMKLPYICKKLANPSCETQDSAYFLDDDQTTCYKIHKKLTAWQKASDICTSENSYLAIPNSQKEVNLLIKTVAPAYNLLLVGFNDKNEEGEYETVDGKALNLIGDMKWNKGQPDDYEGNEDCGSVVSFNGGRLNDITCNYTAPFVCEHYVGDGSIYNILKTRGIFSEYVKSENYTLHLDKHEWNQAKLLCMSEGAQLVVPETQAETEHIKAFLNTELPGDTEGVYIGIYYEYGHLNTIDGTDVKIDQPMEAHSEGMCVVIVGNEQKLQSCEIKLPYICKKYANPRCQTHDTGYFGQYVFGDHPTASCYKMHKKPAVWQEASDICTSENSYLAFPNSEEEAMFLLNTVNQYEKTQEYSQKTASVHNFRDNIILVGLNDKNVEGEFITVDGKALNDSGYVKWHTNQPDNIRDNEDCGCILRHYSGMLNDIPCDLAAIFFCERYVDVGSIYDLVKTKKRLLFSTSPQYTLHTSGENMDGAKRECENEMAQLVVPENADEAEYIWNLFKHRLPTNSNELLIGISLSDKTEEGGSYRTTDGRKIETLGLEWASGEPKSDHRESCVALSLDGKLNNVPCWSRLPYVCKIKSNIECDTEDIQYFPDKTNTHCYKLHLKMLAWEEARNVCSLEQGDLAMLNTKEEAQLLAEELFRHKTELQIPVGFSLHQAFIGLHKSKDNRFIYARVDPADTIYMTWKEGKPSNEGYEDCGTILLNGTLNDFSCLIPLPFICERPGIEAKSV